MRRCCAGSIPPRHPSRRSFEEDQVTDLESTPTLPDLTAAALRRLDSGDRPFLLLVESEEPDSASHDRDLDRLLKGLASIEAILEILLEFTVRDQETLLVFTSDHETGGLALSIADLRNWQLEAIWATEDHTGVVVPLLAVGPGSGAFAGTHPNWEVGRLLRAMLAADAPG